ncbi:carbohydrate esterase family 4 protein [Didymella exigua CBS 183.55]|uniref:Carbohydrate esterase family 4 protein n=1 Tax=Didymella exigua CBS 183.55 TaxID=1150837 RepID=A0A6A5RB85_9PLEO|nr:carbohydrate esterase family 4 protein [Didymella exigua CBS 183.55]KAF1924458.1 carbohydrate esterase family 4 protein [Didymella exigua CBS 183.55]
MRFSEVFAASSVASLVAAHGGIQGAPKLFGLPNDIKIRMPSPRAARAATAMEGPHHLQARQGGDANNRCGPSFGNAVCAAGYCCSGAGYCGTTKDHCNAPDCLFNFGPACDANKTPAGASTRNDARPQKGSVAYGGAGIYACRTPGTVAITYDDGPYIYTDEVLNKFAAAGFKATFFVTGINLGKGAIDEQWSGVVQRMVAEGHQVASHTWSHQDLSAITEAQVYDQMVKNEMAIRNIIGKYPTYMRPPYSSCTGTCPSVLQKLGYVIAYFDLDTDDYNQLTPVKIETAKNNFRNAVNGANPASQSKLAIAHDIHELTALNLTVTMIETLQARGFRGVTMGECMGEAEANWYRDSTPATPGSSTTSTSTGPTSTPTGTISTDGTCGTQGNNQICIGSEFGNCCSQYGYCGKSTDHCGTSCNTLFGNCGTNANPSSVPTATSTSAPQPTGVLTPSIDGTCGGSSGFTCVGFVHDSAKSECCSQYGYCGASTGHCGTGCNPLAGNCGSVSSSVSSSAALSSSAPVSSTNKDDSTSSSAAHTPSVTLTAVHSSSATPPVSTDKSGDKSSTISSIHSDSSSASDKHEFSTASSIFPSGSSSAPASVSKNEEHFSTVSSIHPDVTSSASDKHESTTVSSIYSIGSSSSSVPTKPSQTSSVYADDYSTEKSSSAASPTVKHTEESTSTASSATSYTEHPTTFASSVKPATSTPHSTSSTPTPTPIKSVSQDGKCGGKNGQTCAGYKSSFGLKLECCCKTTGRCSADPWACTAGCDKKNGKCWY